MADGFYIKSIWSSLHLWAIINRSPKSANRFIFWQLFLTVFFAQPCARSAAYAVASFKITSRQAATVDAPHDWQNVAIIKSNCDLFISF